MKFLYLLVTFGITLLLKPNIFSAFDVNLNVVLPLLGTFNILIFINDRVRKNGMWITLENLFLIGYIIVHFQIPFSHSLGWQPTDPYFTFINKDVVNYATWLSTIAVLVWLCGYYLKAANSKPVTQKEFKITPRSIKLLQYFIYTLFPLFIFLVGDSFLGGNYDGGENWGGGSAYIYLLLHSSILLYLALVFISLPKRKSINSVLWSFWKFNRIIGAITLLYLLIFLTAGDRGPVIQIIILTFFVITYKHVKINAFKFVFFLLIGAGIMTVVKFGRTGGTDGRGETNIIVHGLQVMNEDTTPFNPTIELASSNRILYQSINSVPFKHEYLYGLTMLGDLTAGIPFLSGFIKREFNFFTVYSSSSYFFTYLGQGLYPTWGEGSEILGDIYINFGFFGVLIIMFLFGYLVSYLSANFTSSSLFFIFYLVLLVNAIYFNRSPILVFWQPLIIMFTIYKIISFERKYR